MDEVSVKFTASDAALWNAIQRQIAAQAKLAAGVETTTAKASAASKELDRFAEATKRIIATPIERYDAAIQRLDAALAANKLTEQEHARAVSLAANARDAAIKAADGSAQAEARAAAELDRVAAAAKKLIVTPVQEFEAEVQKLQAALASGRITQEEYTAAVAHHQAALEAARKAADGTAQAEARAAAELDRVAAAAKKLIVTPVQEFEAEVVKLQAALASGRITQEEYTAAVAHHQAALEAARKAADGTAQAEAAAAAEMEQFASAAKKLSVTPLQEYERTMQLAKRALDAGKISQQEFNRVQTEAKAKLEASSAGMSDFGRQALGADRASGSLVGSVASLAAGYVSLQTAISLANDYLTDNIKKAEEAYAAQTKLAAAQEPTLQNLTGLSPAVKKQILTVEVPTIQAQTGFPDQAILADTIGKGYSASNDLASSTSATEAASRLTMQNPQTLPKVAGGALDIGQATGIKDAKRTLGFALTVGAVSRVEDPAKIAPSIAPVIRSAVQDVPANQVEQVAREAAAVWSLATKRANDLQGDASATFSTTLTAKLDTFFRNQTQAFATAQEKASSGKPLSADERQAMQLGRVEDPKDLLKRLQLFGDNPAMAQQLLGKEGFGEARFKTYLNQLITGDAATIAELRASIETIRFDASVYDQAARESSVLTPQLAVATARARSEAQKQLSQLNDVDGAIAAYVRETTNDVLRRTRAEGPTGAVQFASEWNSRFWNMLTVSDAEAPKVADEQLIARRNDILRESMLPGFTDPSYGSQFDMLQQLSTVGVDKPGHLTQQDLIRAGIADPQAVQNILMIEQQLQINEDLQRSGNVRQRLLVPPQQVEPPTVVPLAPPATAPMERPPLRAPLSSLLDAPAPAEPPPASPVPARVSPETNQAAAVGNAGQDLVRALQDVAERIRSITVQAPPQIAAAPRQVTLPDYSGRARREQAFAAG